MIVLTLAFVAGILLLQLMPVLPPWYGYLLVPAGLVCLRWRPARLPAMLVVGFFWAAFRAQLAAMPSLAPELEGRTLLVEGRVADLPRHLSETDCRFPFAIERLRDGDDWQEFRATVRLAWYRAPAVPAAGERWRLAVRLKRPHGYANPGGFDYERWLFQQRIHATGYVREDSRNQLLPGSTLDPVSTLRATIARQLDLRQPSGAGPGLVRALTIGDRSAITAAQWDTLRATGTGHLMAISGLHISLVGGLVFLLARRTWAHAGRLAELVPAVRAAAVPALVAAFGYALLAGFGVPARRALVMLAIALLAVLSGRQVRPAPVLCSAAVAVLLLDPLAVLAPGWWLSFWAVTLIVYATANRHGPESRWQRWTQVHVLLALGLSPLLLFLFRQASLVAPLANVVAVPWTGLVVVPLALAGSLLVPVIPGVGEPLLGAAAWLLDLLWPYLEWLGNLDVAVLQRPAPPLWMLVPALGGVLLLCAPRGVPGRLPGMLLLLPVLLARPAVPETGAARATLLDVGQGLAVVVRTHRHTLVYDTGPAFGPSFDTGAAVVVPFLRQQGIGRVDRLVISHTDNDHRGGAESLLREIPVARLTSGVPDAFRNRPADACRRGDRWVWDGVEFAILYPGPGSRPAGNNASCVIRITSAGGQRLLLTGDIEATAERALLDDPAVDVRAEVMTVPHHGSLTSSTPAFVRAVAPEVALIPAGYRNRYGFPQERVTGRYRAIGARLFDSAHHGAIRVRLPAAAGAVEVSAWRCRERRYWRPAACAEEAVWQSP